MSTLFLSFHNQKNKGASTQAKAENIQTTRLTLVIYAPADLEFMEASHPFGSFGIFICRLYLPLPFIQYPLFSMFKRYIKLKLLYGFLAIIMS